MWKISRIAVLIVCLAGTEAAHAYQLVRVLSGDTLLVTDNGRQIRLELSGVWVPSPPGPGVEAEYMGAEAREFVEQALWTLPAYVKEVEPLTPDATSVAVRIRLGKNAEFDLAELLARAGLGLVDRTSIADPDHLEAIYRAERDARRAQRGMHDGGYEEFSRRAGRVVMNLGVGAIAAPNPTRWRGALRTYAEEQRSATRSGATAGGIHRNPVEAIRDWGSQMGLPRDHSASGW